MTIRFSNYWSEVWEILKSFKGDLILRDRRLSCHTRSHMILIAPGYTFYRAISRNCWCRVKQCTEKVERLSSWATHCIPRTRQNGLFSLGIHGERLESPKARTCESRTAERVNFRARASHALSLVSLPISSLVPVSRPRTRTTDQGKTHRTAVARCVHL